MQKWFKSCAFVLCLLLGHSSMASSVLSLKAFAQVATREIDQIITRKTGGKSFIGGGEAYFSTIADAAGPVEFFFVGPSIYLLGLNPRVPEQKLSLVYSLDTRGSTNVFVGYVTHTTGGAQLHRLGDLTLLYPSTLKRGRFLSKSDELSRWAPEKISFDIPSREITLRFASTREMLDRYFSKFFKLSDRPRARFELDPSFSPQSVTSLPFSGLPQFYPAGDIGISVPYDLPTELLFRHGKVFYPSVDPCWQLLQ